MGLIPAAVFSKNGQMKKFLPLIATCLTLSGVPAHAIVGGPWDNNNFNQVNQGTYQATMVMRNGLGMARFTDNMDAAQFSLVNQSVVFYQGIVYLGGAFGNVDWVNYEVNGITNGDTVNNFVDSGTARNIDVCNTTWQCRITEHAPIMRFAGSGVANFFGPLTTFDRQTTTTTTIIQGNTTTVIDTTVVDVGGESDRFKSVGKEVKLHVYGSQISTQTLIQLATATGSGAGGVGGTSTAVVN